MTEINKKLLYKIARLYYFENQTQEQISKKLNISRSKVSRFLDKARSNKIIEIKLHYPSESYGELESLLEKKFGIKECIIIPDFDSPEDIYKHVAEELSPLLQRILKNGDYVGINWGYTLKEVIGRLNISKKININVVPMMGGLGKIDTGVQTNLIASTLAEKFGGISYQIHFPAFLNSIELKEMLSKDSNVKEIFDLSDNINTAILGMSSTDENSTLIKTGIFTIRDIDYLKSLGVVGDINLNWVNSKGDVVPNEISDRTLNIPFEKLKKIKNIIGIGFGEHKVKIIKALLNAKLINIFITDQKTAGRLC
jgi:DNA-binding transcriptional regulator LsrR (DeoR family)